MTTLYINGKPCTVSEVKPSSHGLSEVFVNDYSSRHLLPTELTGFQRSFKLLTSGNAYSFTKGFVAQYAVIRADGFRQDYEYHTQAFQDAENMDGIRAVCKIMQDGSLGWLNVWANAFSGEYELLKAAHSGVKFRVI